MDTGDKEIHLLDKTGKEPSIAVLKKIFTCLRKNNVNRSDLVVKYGPKVIQQSKELELFAITEQVCIAALCVGNTSLVDSCINKLLAQFPNSVRVKKLVGMQKEMNKDFTAALEIYDSILVTAPADLGVIKRKICVYKASCEKSKAIKLLLDILNAAVPTPAAVPGGDAVAKDGEKTPSVPEVKFSPTLALAVSDLSSWVELAELYTENGDYSEAVYCVEECIMLDPHNAWYHVKAADLYYSIGGIDAYIRARKHYTMALNFQSCKHNKRGLFGMIYACRNIITCLDTLKSSSSGSSSSGTSSSGSSSSSGSESDPTTVAVVDYDLERELTVALLKYAQKEMLALTAVSVSASQGGIKATGSDKGKSDVPMSQLLQTIVF